jgi:hypothetical protein
MPLVRGTYILECFPVANSMQTFAKVMVNGKINCDVFGNVSVLKEALLTSSSMCLFDSDFCITFCNNIKIVQTRFTRYTRSISSF